MIIDWFRIAYFKKPVSEVVKETGFKEGALNLGVIYLLLGVIAFLSSLFLTIAPIGASQETILLSILVTGLIYIIGMPIGAIILTAIYAAFVFIVAKILGGKGDYSKTFGSLARILAATIAAYYIPLGIITSILTIILGTTGAMLLGILMLLVGIIQFAMLIAQLYLETKAVSIIHKIGMIKAFVATTLIVLIGIIVVMGLVFVGLVLQIMG
jgi:hypothetical protein